MDPMKRSPGEAGRARLLTIGPRERRLRRMWRAIPSAPRCKSCNSPFGGPGGAILQLVGKGPWPGNPKYCRFCFREIYRSRAGAEIECTLLFADVRGSTGMAETMPVGDYRAVMDRFYTTAAKVVIEHDGIVDKFVGDAVIGLYIPGLTDGHHAQKAVDTGLELLRATARGTDASRIHIGVGVNTGVAYVGAVGTAEHVEFTALDAVNVTARLAAAAAPDELLVGEATAAAAGLTGPSLEHRQLDIRGRSASMGVIVLRVASANSGR
jgi:adenylate cyclase